MTQELRASESCGDSIRPEKASKGKIWNKPDISFYDLLPDQRLFCRYLCDLDIQDREIEMIKEWCYGHDQECYHDCGNVCIIFVLRRSAYAGGPAVSRAGVGAG